MDMSKELDKKVKKLYHHPSQTRYKKIAKAVNVPRDTIGSVL